ncbi:MAG: hypothetical protein ACJ798_06865 [Phenylobacterium sp.]
MSWDQFCRLKADECEMLAQTAASPPIEREWRRMAAEWAVAAHTDDGNDEQSDQSCG